jgi:hypothetical protein
MSVTRANFVAVADRLTEEQKVELLRAYRNTFRVEDHGNALRRLYPYFAERFGVEADLLRTLVREDLAVNRKLYAELRAVLAPVVKKRKPTVATKPQKKKDTAEGQQQQTKKAVVQNRRRGRGPVMECRICGQKVRSNRNGTMALHNAPGRNGLLVPCPGAGLKVAPPTSDDKRPDDRSDPTSIRTVTGGLAGGKR